MLSVRVPPAELNISAFPPVLRNWVIKGLGISSLVYATGHIKDPMPLIAKRRGLSPGGRFPPSFIHQVIIITGLNKSGVKTEIGQYWFLRTSAPWEVLVRNQSALVRIFTIP